MYTEKELGNDNAAEGQVEVDYNVVTDDEEHQAWGWFTRKEMEGLQFVSEQSVAIVRNAFESFEEGLKREEEEEVVKA